MNKFTLLALGALLSKSFSICAQSLTPQVIASSGAYQSNAAGSLSFTIGESNIQTLTSANNILTQGFQQPNEIILLNAKVFLQGYYSGGGQMADVLYNQNIYANSTLETDSVDFELHDVNPPYLQLYHRKVILKQDGSLLVRGIGQIGQPYYIVLKHRNHIETWSADPIILAQNTSYDFSTDASQAFANNQTEVESGIWAFFSGDINQDGVVDGLDYNEWESDNNNFGAGYLATDLNGDGIVDGLDFLLWEMNNNSFVGAIQP